MVVLSMAFANVVIRLDAHQISPNVITEHSSISRDNISPLVTMQEIFPDLSKEHKLTNGLLRMRLWHSHHTPFADKLSF